VLALWCLTAGVVAVTLTRAEVTYAQTSPQPTAPIQPDLTDLQTQEQANQRILEISRNTHTPPHDYVVGRGDLMSVEVFDVPELSRDVRVSQTGTIGLPLVSVRLHVAGLTEIQVQQKVAEVLEANGLVSHPQVMVSVKEKKSKPIVLVGAVAHPMVYQADRPVTLIEVLAEAGGIANDAGDVVIITRNESANVSARAAAEPPEIGPEDAVAATNPSSSSADTPGPPANQPAATPEDSAGKTPSNTETASAAPQGAANGTVPPPLSASDAVPPATIITVNLSEILERGETQNNIPLQAGDVVTIPHAGIVYALGAVARPGGFVATNDRAQLSTLKILALAGGTTAIAKRGDAVIIRKDASGKQQSIPVDLAKIVKRESEDVQLKPSDILYVPPSPGKAALIRLGEIAVGVATASLIYRVTYH
jgi:polysaccharide export outer membrane protein